MTDGNRLRSGCATASQKQCRESTRKGVACKQAAARACVVALACLVPLAGCAGYQVGNWTLYPANIQTVSVPIFESNSFRRDLGERLTEAVVKEIELKTPYKVVNDARADSVLSGRIISDVKHVVANNPYDEPRQVEVNLKVQIQWLDRNSNCIQPMKPIPLPSELATISESATLTPEVGQSVATAQQEAIQRMARQIVRMMEAPW
jgi:hypothetical protein